MKSKFWILVLLGLTACSGENGKSDAYGNFQADEIIVSAQATGEILKMTLNEGQLLDESEVVGLIDTTNLHLQKQQLKSKVRAVTAKRGNIQAMVEVHRQQLQNLQTDLQRIDNLYKSGAATEKQLTDIKGAVELAKKQIKATRSQLDGIRDEISALEDQIAMTNEKISKSFIRNPVKGTVLTKYASKGEFTAAGKPLYKIANLENLELKAYISGDQLDDIRLGQEVEVLTDKDEKAYNKMKGKVSWIASNAEFTPKTIQTKKDRVNLVYAVKVRVKNDGSLKIGMPGEINFNNTQKAEK